MKNLKLIVISLASLLLSVSVFADQFSLFLENDVCYNTDRYYTHATRLQYTTDNNLGYSIGQNMYTPVDKLDPNLIPNDRPYAGYLYASVFDTIYTNNGEFFWELQAGVVGPDSFAKQTQIWIHEHIGSEIPLGWDNQIYNHLATLIMLRYTTHLCDSKYFAIDPYIGLEAGNLEDDVNAGFNIYLGYNLPATRNQQRVIPVKAVRGETWNPYIYLWGGLEPRYVMYNMLLEDPRFTIHPESFVYDRNLGIVAGCKYFEIAFTFCLRSDEFKEQSSPQRFGSLKLSTNF